MDIDSIYITILLIIILIIIIIYYFCYNSKKSIEKYSNLDCNNYRDAPCEENILWCFIKKFFCFIIYLKNKIFSDNKSIKTKDNQILNLEDEVVKLDNKNVELNKNTTLNYKTENDKSYSITGMLSRYINDYKKDTDVIIDICQINIDNVSDEKRKKQI